jgi:hypothetical protein
VPIIVTIEYIRMKTVIYETQEFTYTRRNLYFVCK